MYQPINKGIILKNRSCQDTNKTIKILIENNSLNLLKLRRKAFILKLQQQSTNIRKE